MNKIKGTFCERNGALTKAQCHPKSFRWIKRGTAWILICCPKGEWRRDRCRVGTRAYKILSRPKRSRCSQRSKRVTFD